MDKGTSRSISPVLVTAAMIMVFVLTLLAYRGALNDALVWDSVYYLVGNESRISSLSLENLQWMMTTMEMGSWHPLTWLSWAIDYQLLGTLDPAGFHLSNVTLHGVNSALVLLLMLQLIHLAGPEKSASAALSGSAALVAACLVGLLFALHPQHVESVAWVAGRKDLLCQLFMLLSLITYLRFGSAPGGRQKRWYVASWLFALLAVMAKPMAVSLPVIMLVLDAYPLGRLDCTHSVRSLMVSLLRRVAEKTPFILLSLMVAVIAMVAQDHAIASTIPWSSRVLNGFNSYLAYLSKLLLPLALSPHYPFVMMSDSGIEMQQLVPVAGFMGISFLAVWLWLKGHRWFMAAWAIYVVSLLPVIGVVPFGLPGMADRYAYFPTLPFYCLGGGLIYQGLTREKARKWLTALTAAALCAGTTSINRPVSKSTMPVTNNVG